MTDDVHQLLGAYVLGGLDAADRERFASHLPDCAACRDELARSAVVPALLRRVDGLWEPDQGPAAEPPAALLAEVRHERSRRRQRHLLVAAAALVVGLLGGALAGGALAGRTPSSDDPALVASLDGAAGSTSSGQVALTAKPWGTAVSMVVRDLPEDGRFELRVVGADGQAQTACSWSATGRPEVTVTGATGLSVASIDRLEVVDAADGEVYAVTRG